MADIVDRLTQLMYIQGQMDPSRAPLVKRPVLPHLQLRKQRRSKVLRRLTALYDD